MSDSKSLRVLGAAAVLAALAAGPACVDIVAAQFVDRDDKKFAVNGRPDVSLSTFDGSIEIRASDRPEVAVTIEKRGGSKEATDRIEVHAEQNGNRVVVDVRLPKGERMFGIGWNMGTSAKLIVSVPGGSDVQARSGDGSITVERITGTLDLRSGDGSIHGHVVGGTLRVHTGDGSIKLDQVNGALDADTGDGSITVDGKLSSVRVRTGDGSVTIRAAAGSAATADWSITTGDGSVTLELPDGFSGELDAHTGDGRIALNDLTLSNVTGKIGRTSLRGSLGSGGRAVRVRTGDGSITLKKF